MAEEKSTTTLNKMRVEQLLSYIAQTFYKISDNDTQQSLFEDWKQQMFKGKEVPLLGNDKKIELAYFPDYVLSRMVFGGTVNGQDLATVSENFKASYPKSDSRYSKYYQSDDTILLSTENSYDFEGVFFLAEDVTNIKANGILDSLKDSDGRNPIQVGDWVVSIGSKWTKIDNTDAVRTVLNLTGNITAKDIRDLAFAVETELSGAMWYKDGDVMKAIATSAFGRSLLNAIANQSFTGLIAEKATKLETPRTIWGNSFDGSGDIGGNIVPLGDNVSDIGNASKRFRDLFLNRYIFLNTNSEGIYVTGEEISWHNANNAYAKTLLSFTKDGLVQVSNAFSVLGASNLQGSLHVKGATTLQDTLNVGKLATLDSLKVNNDTTLGSNISTSKLTVDAVSTFNGDVTVADGKQTILGGALQVKGATTLNSTLAVTGKTTLNGALEVNNTSVFNAVATHNDHILLVNGKNIAGQLQDDKTNISLLGVSNTDTVLVGYGAVGKYNTNIFGKTVNVLTKDGVTSAQFDENKNLKVFGYISGMQGVAAKGIADFGENGVGSGSGGTRYTLQKAEDTNKVTLQLIAEDGSGTSTQDINTFNATRAGLVPNALSTSHILFGGGWRALVADDIPNLDWAKITTGKPTTLGGYGITDAYTETQIENGIFPNMRVGLADDLGDIEETLDEEYTFQPTANPNEIRDGYAQIESLKGNSLVWNQKVVKITDSLTNQWNVASNLTITVENGVITAYCKTQEIGMGYIDLNLKLQGFNRVGHKYAILIDAKSDTANTRVLTCIMGGVSTFYNVNSTGWERAICLGEHLDDNVYCLFRMYNNTTGNTVLFRNQQLIDLTQMFGEGNEPTTVEEFERRCPKGMSMDYNEGEVVHFNGDIKSVGLNQWDEEWELGYFISGTGNTVSATDRFRSKNYIPALPNVDYYANTSASQLYVFCYDSNKKFIGLVSSKTTTNVANSNFLPKPNTAFMKFYVNQSTYNHDICINLSDPDKNGTYEPYTEFRRDLPTELFEGGMKSAGTVHDEIYWDKAKGKYIKVTRIGEVDLGTLSWSYNTNATTGETFIANMTNDIPLSNPLNSVKNYVCAKYTSRTANEMYHEYKGFDKVVFIEDGNKFKINDSSYTDAESFKTAMSGVMLYYELAEPIVEEIDIPYMDYQVSNSGTEEIVSEVPTTPIKARVTYNFDTIGTVKQNRFDVSILKSSISNLSKGIGVSGNWVLDGLKIGTYDVLHKGNTSLVIDSGDNFGFTLKVADSQIQMSDITEDELRQMINTAWGTNYEA